MTACEVCGCTDQNACIGLDMLPCHWASPGVCSCCTSGEWRGVTRPSASQPARQPGASETPAQEKGPPPDKVHIAAQIAEVERELGQRARVYPGLVSKGSMRQSEADLHVRQMQAVKATLEWCRANEAEIREFIQSKRAAA